MLPKLLEVRKSDTIDDSPQTNDETPGIARNHRRLSLPRKGVPEKIRVPFFEAEAGHTGQITTNGPEDAVDLYMKMDAKAKSKYLRGEL
jgi:hypothetical protein